MGKKQVILFVCSTVLTESLATEPDEIAVEPGRINLRKRRFVLSRLQPTQKSTHVVVHLPCHPIASPPNYGRELRFCAPTILSDAASVDAALGRNGFRPAEGHHKLIIELHFATPRAGRIASTPSAHARNEKFVRLSTRTVELIEHDCSASHEDIPSNIHRAVNGAEQIPDSRRALLRAIHPLLH
jgi:hypothetical protein